MLTGLKLSEFRSKISDVARPNRFEVAVYPPAIYKEYSPNEIEKVIWSAESAQIPQRNQGEVTIKYHGMELKLPGDYSKENINIGFINTYGWEGRNFFERWMELHMQSIGKSNDRKFAYELINDSKLVVNQLGRTKDTKLATYEFYDVFPTTISSIDLNMGSFDEAEKFTVTFAYSYFKQITLVEV